MDFEIENKIQWPGYGSARKRIDESLAFWSAIGSGQPVVVTSSEVLSESWPPPTPDQAYREAMVGLDRWRASRAAHGSRNAKVGH